jgi:hypothetical protein
VLFIGFEADKADAPVSAANLVLRQKTADVESGGVIAFLLEDALLRLVVVRDLSHELFERKLLLP